MRTVYLAQVNSDQTEGRGPMITVAAFFDERDAKKAAKGRGVMGVGDGEVTHLKVYDSYGDFERDREEGIRQRVLDSLSSEERRALGLD